MPFKLDSKASKYVTSKVTDYLSPQNDTGLSEKVNKAKASARPKNSEVVEISHGEKTRELDQSERYKIPLDERPIKGPNGATHAAIPTLLVDLFNNIEVKYNERE